MTQVKDKSLITVMKKKEEKSKEYEEKISHGTSEIPIALHKLTYPIGTQNVFYLHWHREMEFLVVTQGTIEITVEETAYVLQPGECIFINSNMYHSARALTGEGCAFFAVVFSYEFLQTDLHTHFGRHYIRPVLKGKLGFIEKIQEDGDWQSAILKALYEINELDHMKLLEHELMLKTRMYAIWELCFNHAKIIEGASLESSMNQERLEPVLAYIAENYSYEITLKELADIIPMSEGQFCRVFRQTMNRTPVQYLMRYRIIQSCRLLIETDKKIAEIANLAGFNNISYYNKVFLSIVGCTPKEYRNSNF